MTAPANVRSTLRAAAVVLLSGCTLVTEFDRSKVIENSSNLCSDGIDNDGNGLVDCQDFGCLAQEVCCTIPTIAIVDDFEEQECASASCEDPDEDCAAIDPQRWKPWGVPYPIVCEGTLSPYKSEQCYNVGVLSAEALALRPGLRVEVGIVGRPEIKGRLEVGLTFQDHVQSSIDPCEPLDVVEPVISIQQLADSDGCRFVATFDQRQVGVSELVTDVEREVVAISIEEDRRVHYEVGGHEFAISPAEQPIPDTEPLAHLSLAGRGKTARFDDVAVTAGTQCDTPGAWEPQDPFIVIGENEDASAWDSFAVFAPGVGRTPGGTLRMYYTGCTEKLSECDPLRTGVGRADADASFTFTRKEDCAVVGAEGVVCDGGVTSPFASVYNNFIDLSPTLVDDAVFGYASQMSEGDEIQTLTLFGDELAGISPVGDAPQRVRVGTSGEWDSYEVCCATALKGDDGLVRLWYAGRDAPHAPWRIGLATSSDGIEFQKHAENPVLGEGAAGSFDDAGVSAPTVSYDARRALYRVWYEARGFLGVASIGYAVSLDGVEWFKYPGNPVVSPEQIGLVSVGAPEVLAEGGRTLMWLHGEATDTLGTRIYGLANTGGLTADDGEPE